MIKKIEIKLNKLGFYDVFVDGEEMLSMLAKDEVGEGVQHLLSFTKEELLSM